MVFIMHQIKPSVAVNVNKLLDDDEDNTKGVFITGHPKSFMSYDCSIKHNEFISYKL